MPVRHIEALFGYSAHNTIGSMKTTIDIPDDLLLDLMKLTAAATKREAVLTAIAEYTQRRRMAELSSVLGTFVDFMDREDLAASREEQ
jgi:hypothetical protein